MAGIATDTVSRPLQIIESTTVSGSSNRRTVGRVLLTANWTPPSTLPKLQ